MIFIKILITLSLLILFFLDIKKNSKLLKSPKLFFINRFVIILILAIQLFNFNFSFNYRGKEKNKIAVFIDNSSSINEKIKTNKTLKKQFSKLNFFSNNENLKFELYSFDSDVNRIKEINTINFLGKETDFENLLNYINKIESNNIIIISDGINTGPPIKNHLNELNKKFIYTLGIGEKTFNDDISIDNIHFIHSSFLSDSITLVVNYSYNLKQDIQNKIELFFDDENNNEYKKINFSSGSKIYGNIDFTLNKRDVQKLNSIRIEPIKIENDKLNNVYKIDYKKIFNFEKILIISGELSSSTTFIKNLINSFDAIVMSHQYKIKEKWNQKYNYEDYDLFVFDNYPINKNDIIDTDKFIESEKIIISFSGKDLGSEMNDYIANATKLNYRIEENNKKFIKIENSNLSGEYPPIISNISWKSHKNTDCLLYYDDNSCVISNNNNFINVFISNLKSYNLQLQNNNNFKNLLLKYLYIAVNRGSNLVETNFKKTIYDLNELIEIQLVPVINSNFNLSFEVLDSLNNVIFEKKINNFSNIIDINFKINNPGEFNVITKLINNGLILFNDSSNIRINNLNVEKRNIFLNEQYLRNISMRTNSKYYHLSNINELISNFDDTENVKIYKYGVSYLSINKFLWILIILISIDWYIRTKRGIL